MSDNNTTQKPQGFGVGAEIKRERSKMKGRPFREKWEYFWEYYKLHTFIVAVCLYFFWAMLNHYVLNPPPKPFVHVAFYGSYLPPEKIVETTEKWQKDLNVDTEHYEIASSNYYPIPTDPEMNYAMVQRFDVAIAANEIDIILTTKENFAQLCARGYVKDIGEVLDPEQVKQLGDKVLMGQMVEEGKNDTYTLLPPQPFGISVSDKQWMTELGIQNKEMVLCFVVNLAQTENANQTAMYLLYGL